MYVCCSSSTFAASLVTLPLTGACLTSSLHVVHPVRVSVQYTESYFYQAYPFIWISNTPCCPGFSLTSWSRSLNGLRAVLINIKIPPQTPHTIPNTRHTQILHAANDKLPRSSYFTSLRTSTHSNRYFHPTCTNVRPTLSAAYRQTQSIDLQLMISCRVLFLSLD